MYTDDGRNVSLHSYWHDYGSFDYLTLDCESQGKWVYKYPESGSTVRVTGVFCFWLTDTGIDEFLGQHVRTPDEEKK